MATAGRSSSATSPKAKIRDHLERTGPARLVGENAVGSHRRHGFQRPGAGGEGGLLEGGGGGRGNASHGAQKRERRLKGAAGTVAVGEQARQPFRPDPRGERERHVRRALLL
jgi:hypothetical protein